jgi:hypothetical protein
VAVRDAAKAASRAASGARWASRAGVLALCGLCACFSAIRAYREGLTCNPEAAREAGAQDARAGRLMNENYAEICGVEENALNGVYRDAFDDVPPAERSERSWLDRLLGRDRAAEAPPPAR